MKGLISAIQFMTRLPMGRSVVFEPRDMVPYFPVVGLILGTAVSMFDFVLLNFWPLPVVALLDVLLLVVLTGAFHLDGLGDSADGLYNCQDRKRALAIMKDSRVGVMGLIMIVSVMAVKWAGLAHMAEHRSLLIVIVPALARGSMIFGMAFLPYGRPDGGTGHAFFENPIDWRAFVFLALPIALSGFAGIRGLWLILCFALITVGILMYYKARMECITGDMLGAMTETVEAGLFLLICVGGLP